uniref:Acyl-CoA synthetase family member 3, mitochondrial n=1 Tax=Phallusia mammillata TaxID=59560 RepID=A0A6F9D6D1_9ASCI|nr:acyl-CoA synthetase family member 3, mitochondrial [Phallusia mammillata]
MFFAKSVVKRLLLIKLRRNFGQSASNYSVESVLPFLRNEYGQKLAIKDSLRSFTYSELLYRSRVLKDQLVAANNGQNLLGKRIAILTPNNASFTVSQWSAWMCGAAIVPLCPQHPKPELSYVMQDSQASVIVSSDEHQQVAEELSSKLNIVHVSLDNLMNSSVSNPMDNFSNLFPDNLLDLPASIMYTSGTTGRPKGVLFTHRRKQAQVNKVSTAWELTSTDILLHILPLHHMHGMVVALLCPLCAGGTVKMLPKFDPASVWKDLLDDSCDLPSNVFMAVPTIYAKLIDYFDEQNFSIEETREKCKRFRLMVSGSAALPTPLLHKWKEITGHVLLERYGTTEFGMGLTNPLYGPKIPGSVGLPFPGVEAKLVQTDSDGTKTRTIVEATESNFTVHEKAEELEGELLVKSDSMFEGYWNKPNETEDSFTEAGWFKTGDTAKFQDGAFFIKGRTSVDIIKSGGYKISALDIERTLLEHPAISEVAVLGIDDETWGQRIVAVVKLSDKTQEQELKDWCKEHLPKYQIPKEFKVVNEIPRNVMGKVNKKQLIMSLFPK